MSVGHFELVPCIHGQALKTEPDMVPEVDMLCVRLQALVPWLQLLLVAEQDLASGGGDGRVMLSC